MSYDNWKCRAPDCDGPEERPEEPEYRWPYLPAEGELDIDAACDRLEAEERELLDRAAYELLRWGRGDCTTEQLRRFALELVRRDTDGSQLVDLIIPIINRRAA